MTTTEHRERVPIADPKLGTAEQDAVRDVLESGTLTNGEQVRQFESEFASFCDSTHGVATTNGTTALHAALEALDIGDGDRVLTTPFTFVATANAIRFAGAEPVFVDIDPETYNIDPEKVEKKIRALDGDVAGILAVHLYGHPADLDRLTTLAEQYEIPLIEDAAQAHGATYRGNPVGSVGNVGCFSFYPTKNMTTGEGGMIVTDSDDIADRARQFINHGRNGHYDHERVGHNFRMTDIAAAIGRVQLNRLPSFLHARRHNANQLRDGLATLSFGLPHERRHTTHAYHQFTIRSERRDELRTHLDEFGVDTGIYYPTPVHRQPAYSSVSDSLPVAERAASEVLSIPVHPELSSEDINTVITSLEYFDTYL